MEASSGKTTNSEDFSKFYKVDELKNYKRERYIIKRWREKKEES